MDTNFMVILGLVLGVAVLVLCTVKLKIHPFFSLIATTVVFAVVSGMNLTDMLEAFTSGMGGTMSDIGLVIALGTVTGALFGEIRGGGDHGEDYSEADREKARGSGTGNLPDILFPFRCSVIQLSCC